MLTEKQILLIIGGGIAAYKTLDLIRRLRDRGACVHAILTKAGAQFVTPLSVSSLTGEKAYENLFDLTDEAEMGHIQLSRAADLIVVAPATANLLARMAAGLADDLATTTLLATDKDILVAPAMNVRMWQHKATTRNVAQLEKDGVLFVGPNEGDMACGEYGPGRLAEPLEILDAIIDYFGARDDKLAALPSSSVDGQVAAGKPLSGRRIVVTAGPTHEPIDPVRYIANRSSGKQGYAIAAALRALGADIVLVSGPVALAPPAGVALKRAQTAQDMLKAVEAAMPADALICAAAVADWRVAAPSAEKIKKTKDGAPKLNFEENPDILRKISKNKGKDRPALVIGFAAETENVIENGKAKRKAKGCDWILANDVSPETGILGGDENQVHLISRDKTESWPTMLKTKVAETLAWRIAAHFSGADVTGADFTKKKDAGRG